MPKDPWCEVMAKPQRSTPVVETAQNGLSPASQSDIACDRVAEPVERLTYASRCASARVRVRDAAFCGFACATGAWTLFCFWRIPRITMHTEAGLFWEAAALYSGAIELAIGYIGWRRIRLRKTNNSPLLFIGFAVCVSVVLVWFPRYMLAITDFWICS